VTRIRAVAADALSEFLAVAPGHATDQSAYISDMIDRDAMPRAPTFETIGYIGVVPEQRGHGHINDLLAHGTSTLRGLGTGRVIRADTDVDNLPMAAAFERAGYRRFATRREFEIRL